MVTEFGAQLLSLTIDKQRLALLAQQVTALLAEMTTPKDLKNEAIQRARRIELLESFCSKWSVTKIWVSELIDRYEDLEAEGSGPAIRLWLTETMKPLTDEEGDVPSPRIEPDPYPAVKLV